MPFDKPQNVQDVFLNNLRKKRMPVTVFLASGVKLQGTITGFDNFCLVLRRGPQVQLVYKHTVATVVPSGPLSLFEEEGPEHPAAVGTSHSNSVAAEAAQ